MKIKILVLNINDLGGIERVAINLYKMFKKTKEYQDVEIVSVYGNSAIHSCTILNGYSENSKLFSFAQSLDEGVIILSLYDRFSIKLSLIRKLFFLRFKIYACQHADYYAHRTHTRFLRYVTYHWVDKIVALTREDGLIYKRNFKNVSVIPNVLGFYPKAVKKISERKIDCSVAGRLVPIKQYDHFIHLIDRVNQDFSHYDGVYKIFGDGVEREKLNSLLNASSLKDKDVLVGRINNIEDELCNSKFFFVTSLRESFSMVILEAMACGCIVVSYDCPTGPRELIRDGFNGFLVSLNDKDGLIACYKRILTDSVMCQAISDNARVFSKEFLEESLINQWIHILNE